MVLYHSLSPRGPRESMPVKSEESVSSSAERDFWQFVLSSSLPWTAGFAQTVSEQKIQRDPTCVRSPNLWLYEERTVTYARVASRKKDRLLCFEDVLIICSSTSGCFPFPVSYSKGCQSSSSDGEQNATGQLVFRLTPQLSQPADYTPVTGNSFRISCLSSRSQPRKSFCVYGRVNRKIARPACDCIFCLPQQDWCSFSATQCRTTSESERERKDLDLTTAGEWIFPFTA